MMRSLKENNIKTQTEAREYIGKLFKTRMYELPPWTTDEQICLFLIKYAWLH